MTEIVPKAQPEDEVIQDANGDEMERGEPDPELQEESRI